MKARFFEKQNDAMVRCTACRMYCVLKPGATGLCGVRENKDGVLHLTVYGKAAAAHVDPIEKKPFFHVLPGRQVFTVGTVGCNFSCQFCQNWELSQLVKKDHSRREGRLLAPEQVVEHCMDHNIPIIAFSYNEPAIFIEYALDVIRLAKQNGIKTVMVSNGYLSKEVLVKLSGLLDAINIDLKSFSESFYQKHCKARLAPVLDTIRTCYRLGIWVELTTLVIPGENDDDKQITSIIDFIASVDSNIPWHISAFHPNYNMMHLPCTSHKRLIEIYEQASNVLSYVYVGNVLDTQRANTYCPSCKHLLIKRGVFASQQQGLHEGQCSFCHQKIHGVFS